MGEASADWLSEVLALVDLARGDADAQSDLARGLESFYAHDRAKKYLKDQLSKESEFDQLLSDAESLVAEYLLGDLN